MFALEDQEESLRLREDLGMDSLDILELAMDVEVEYGVKVTSSDIKNWKVVKDVKDTTKRISAPIG